MAITQINKERPFILSTHAINIAILSQTDRDCKERMILTFN